MNTLGLLGSIIYSVILITPFLFFKDFELDFILFFVIVGFIIASSVSWHFSKYYLNIEIEGDLIKIYSDRTFFVNIDFFEFRKNELKDFFFKKSNFYDYFSLMTSNRERILIYHFQNKNNEDKYNELIEYFSSIYEEKKEIIYDEEERIELAQIESNGGGIYLFLGIISFLGSIVLFLEFQNNEFMDNYYAIFGCIGGLWFIYKYFDARRDPNDLKIREKNQKRELKKKNRKINK